MEPKLYLPILNNLENLYKSKNNDDFDVVIQAGEEHNQKDIYAHSAILCCQSNYFRAAFSTNWSKKEDEKYVFKKPNISPHNFEVILRYLYCGKIDLNVKDGSNILKLSIATDELGLDLLCDYIQEFLIKNKKEILQYDPIGNLEIILQHEAFAKFKDCCLKVISSKPEILFGTDKILSLPAQILEALLKRKDLALSEIEVWNNLIKWTHAQQPTVNKDPSKWTKGESILMKRALSRFIPLIRFHNITLKEYYNRVAIYENVLPKRLKLEVSKFYSVSYIKQIGLLPSRSFYNNRKVNSVIIDAKHLALFAGWIVRKDVTLKQNPFTFNLILRGSHDGFDAATFHTKCDNKGATIVVATIKGTNQIVGGYNQFDWSGNGYKRTSNSFIFLFENYDAIYTGRIHRVKTVYRNRLYGPRFGINNYLGLNCDGKWRSYVTNIYPYLNIPKSFEINDYEVFQVIKRS